MNILIFTLGFLSGMIAGMVAKKVGSEVTLEAMAGKTVQSIGLRKAYIVPTAARKFIWLSISDRILFPDLIDSAIRSSRARIRDSSMARSCRSPDEREMRKKSSVIFFWFISLIMKSSTLISLRYCSDITDQAPRRY